MRIKDIWIGKGYFLGSHRVTVIKGQGTAITVRNDTSGQTSIVTAAQLNQSETEGDRT